MDDIYTKKINKTDGQIRCLKVNNNIFFKTEGVKISHKSVYFCRKKYRKQGEKNPAF
jgi:hypothetical protein